MASSDIHDLATALNLFKETTNSFAFDQSLKQANQEAARIRSGQEDELEKRKQLQVVANNLSMQAALAEKPATTIAELNKAIGPEHFATGDQAILAGQLQGKPELTIAGMEANKKAKADELMLKKENEAFQLKRDKIHADLQLEVAGMKGGKLHTLPTSEVTKITDQQSKIGVWDGLISELEANPSWSSFLYKGPTGAIKEMIDGQTNPAWATWKSGLMNQYFAMRKEITGVAGSQREYAEIQRNQPSFSDSQDVSLAKMKAVKINYETALARKMHGLAKASYDLRGFDLPSDPDAIKAKGIGPKTIDMQPEAHRDALSHLPPGSSFAGKARDPKDGTIKNWYKLPSGQIVGR